ncbi:haloacid dehalogenase-like hydrolase [Synechococcus sp. UW179B]|uniref:haloacid dehalogenase-like hydrolase n=1 Tax=Synechococcus sp. UW179B TaxID=2575516 RepID=UPI000E0F4DD0|nr:haloacid dehalogenase-like hydrolase [Synechococcus sp. UW179B]
MTLLGLDFDNTLVQYDKLFHKLAVKKGLIEKSLIADKTKIRDYLRQQGKEDEFTLLQGEVYGQHILDAEPAIGMLEALKKLKRQGIPMVLISHKTRTPYKGPEYDLQEAARRWLKKHEFFSEKGLGWTENQVIFEESKENKIERIIKEGCTHYIDDLPEIIKQLPATIRGIHYSPKASKKINSKDIKSLSSWEELDAKMYQ